MPDRYYDKTNRPGSELFLESTVAHLVYDSSNPDHVALPDINPFFHPIPPGKRLTWSDRLPDGLADKPTPPPPTAEEQAALDLKTAGVNRRRLTRALYSDRKGDAADLTSIDASVAAVALSSGLSASAVRDLID